jgi:hypothetical protein
MPDAAERSRLHLVLAVEERDHPGGVVGDRGVVQAQHRGADHPRHRLVSPRNVETNAAEPIVEIGDQAEVAVLRDALAHLPQLVAKARRIHVQDDRRKLPSGLRTCGERRLASVFRVHHDVLLNHRRRLLSW